MVVSHITPAPPWQIMLVVGDFGGLTTAMLRIEVETVVRDKLRWSCALSTFRC